LRLLLVAGEAVLSPEVVELVGGRCLLEPMGGGNARLLDLLDPYHLPPEVWVAAGQADRQTVPVPAG
jgi:hypothetical protein